jgi:hypothetical protein
MGYTIRMCVLLRRERKEKYKERERREQRGKKESRNYKKRKETTGTKRKEILNTKQTTHQF